ncbi:MULTISPECIES: hypothetical protein [unclassified Methylobacterium]|uniref:hypothetical protein n=1 Tax=unclassified Methylobacterium TaxID=2615210 RepID=UPI000CAB3E5F|nr:MULTISPECIES: hypothetical protein [unclassified Methylobacterium]PIU06651.1 MAG: hypothetical protein COT56_08440 [Methylobacterium sp. CG09_land_8_20_14_0_10_71_15]PIU12089.1 MAG: hypothetical protein COT28_16805 [Methylobacterium sp. CG08_land_8_20_14_0_20_71_15]GBU19668.1 hypothetical protein AwMethylo_38830 [Methylobacterium sp.]
MYSHEQITSAFDDRDRLATGWEPPNALWAHSRILNRWAFGIHPHTGTMALVGMLGPDLRTCAPTVAMLTGPGGIGWLRTLTGWIRLALTEDERHKEGRLLLPEHARELELAALAAGYRAPRRSLRPEGPLASDARWHHVADHFERDAADPETAFAVYYARQMRLGLDEARAAVVGFWYARHLEFE